MTVIYLIFLVLAAFGAWRYDGIEEHNPHKSLLYWALCALLICISGFSYGLGGDKFVYMEAFENMPDHIESLTEYVYLKILVYNHMPFWSLLNVFVKRFFDSFYVLQFIQSGIVNIVYCYIVSKYTHRRFLFLLFYFLFGAFFLYNTEVMREGVAIAFCLPAIENYLDGKKTRFLLLTFTGLMFHMSAAIVLIFPFCKIKITRRTLLLSFFTALAVWGLSDFVLTHIASLVMGGMGMVVQKILFYSTQATNIFGFLRSCITFMILPFMVIYYNLQWETDPDLKARKEKLAAFYIVLSLLGCAFAGFIRLKNYAEVYFLIFFAEFIYLWFKTKDRFVVRTICIVGFIFLIPLKFFIYYPINKAYSYQRYFPYTCIINEDKSVYFRKEIHMESTNNNVTDENYRKLE